MTNTAMTCVVFKTLSDELDKIAQKPEFNTQRKRIENLSEAIKYFREGLLNAVKKEWEGRNFLTAYHLVGQDWGKEKIFLLPNAFALQIPEIENIKKEKLFSEIENRILKNEKLGARNREEPQTDGMHYAKPGSGENGGFWWVPNSQLILGVNTFNKSKAKELFNKMSLHNYSKNYPNYWVGQWSASDAVQSSIGEFEGYQGYTYSSLQPAFKIYLWNRLREK
jgi:cellobiose phosphorylase